MRGDGGQGPVTHGVEVSLGMWDTKTDPKPKALTWRAGTAFVYLFPSVDLNHLSPFSFPPQM